MLSGPEEVGFHTIVEIFLMRWSMMVNSQHFKCLGDIVKEKRWERPDSFLLS